ncbi:MAG: alpha-1,2-fucosyltransferase [Caulobacteraceae bacterium]
MAEVFLMINGGLGNQLFQYAAALTLTGGNSNLIKLSLSNYLPRPNMSGAVRSPDILKFDQRFRLLDEQEEISVHRLVARPRLAKCVFRVAGHLGLGGRPKLIAEGRPYRDLSTCSLSRTVCLVGFWQDYRYAAKLRDGLPRERVLKSPIPPEVAALESAMRAGPAVAVHFRRGDYLEPEIKMVHGELGFDYYDRALGYVDERLAFPRRFLFSDDPGWAMAVAKPRYGGEVVALPRGLGPEWEMYLMSRCQAVVAANSTFSWWSAFLIRDDRAIRTLPLMWLGRPVNRHNRLDAPEFVAI